MFSQNVGGYGTSYAIKYTYRRRRCGTEYPAPAAKICGRRDCLRHAVESDSRTFESPQMTAESYRGAFQTPSFFVF